MIPEIQIILVPKGAEYQAVCRGLRGVTHPPTVFPIPVGFTALIPYLKSLQESGCLNRGQRVLVMGLCGGLNSNLNVGMPVLYKACTTSEQAKQIYPLLTCDRPLTTQIQAQLPEKPRLVTAITSDRVISRSSEKQQLFQQTQADVVDMEGYAILEVLRDLETAVVTLRVVSDDSQHDIPDLSHAFGADGSLKPLALATAMFRRPAPAIRLIRGSTKSLKVLQQITYSLFKDESCSTGEL